MFDLTPVNGVTRQTHFQIIKQHNFQHCTGRITWRLRLAKPHILGKLFPLVKRLGPMAISLDLSLSHLHDHICRESNPLKF